MLLGCCHGYNYYVQIFSKVIGHKMQRIQSAEERATTRDGQQPLYTKQQSEPLQQQIGFQAQRAEERTRTEQQLLETKHAPE